MTSRAPKKQKPTAAQKAMEARQMVDLADLDEEQNRRIKQIFLARNGGRAFRSPTALRAASNTAGGAAPAAAAPSVPYRSGGSTFRRVGGTVLP